MLHFESLQIDNDPKTWSVFWTEDGEELSRACGMQVFSVQFGQHDRLDMAGNPEPAPAVCFMRESIYTALLDGTFCALPQDNAYGLLIVDRKTKISVPRVKVFITGLEEPVEVY